ncbi:hypothetical protein HID58_043087 [Brassica napus]|uniref:F-box associated beta-propeller type 3 domain-containing protein n=1 Tax=Brassica napus TaxID=3708 RepID=A0ABQ8BFK5_BRANA|nr:hypothetical protein HID58_043087 [Brassica napus]
MALETVFNTIHVKDQSRITVDIAAWLFVIIDIKVPPLTLPSPAFISLTISARWFMNMLNKWETSHKYMNQRVISLSHFGHDLITTAQSQNPNENSSVVATRRKVHVICNPVTGEFLNLPKKKNLPKVKEPKSNPTKTEMFYFGYDPIGRQFKMLCKTTSNTHHKLENVYGEGSKANSVLRRTLEYMVIGDICINGVLYIRSAPSRTSMIVCFDFRSEKFSFINGNYDMNISYRSSNLSLLNYKGKLGMYDSNRSRNAYGCSAFLTTLFHRQIIDYVADIICSAKLQQLLYLINHLQRQ